LDCCGECDGSDITLILEYGSLKHYSFLETGDSERQGQAAEIRRLKAELKRVSEERDILKKPQRTLPRSHDKVRIHPGTRNLVSCSKALPHDESSFQWGY